MTDGESYGDEVYQPEPGEAEQREDTGLLDQEDTLDAHGAEQTIEEGYSPPERPRGAEHHGVTAAEQREGESLDQRLAEEVPEEGAGGPGEPTGPERSAGAADYEADADLGRPGARAPRREVGDLRTGRLVAPRQGAAEESGEGVAAEDVGVDSAVAPAEEAAVHTIDDDRELPPQNDEEER
ncbi:DUF5709 domain-containing protein [Phaeacidiphilus oryzae]|uniref:DUF5709 domain-containing protein n=1 Tax=Phaeacidiphilus oryzae TaxID=348818 RepID=UPI000559C9F7|nr:DUF5709 domain-containing protein [Phaeacidiphilus oryzae]